MSVRSINAQSLEKFLTGLFLIIITSAATISLAHAGGSTHGILVMASADVESSNCKYVGDVWGTSSWGKSSLTVWKHKAEHKAMKMAKDLNATHVYWEGQSEGAYGNDPHAYGKAYRCDASGKQDDVASVKDRAPSSVTN